MHTLPNLPYNYNALEPWIDEQTMRIHHTKHHQAYIDKLNAALEKYPELAKLSIEDLMCDLEAVPEVIRAAVRNHGGGHLNHSLFWQMLAPAEESKSGPKQKTLMLINQAFGSVEEFKKQYKDVALARFGSGWTWLVQDRGGAIVINSTANQDTPVSEGKRALLGLDVWEHAYYLKYQNRRAEYIDAFWNIVNWGFVENQIG